MSYEKRHRKFSLDRPKKIQRNLGTNKTFVKTMRDVSDAYHSFIPHKNILRPYSKYLLGLKLFIFGILLLFATIYPVEITIPIRYLHTSMHLNITRDFAFAYFFINLYLWNKNYIKIIISDNGIQVNKDIYQWKDIQSIQFVKSTNKTRVWYIFTKKLFLRFKVFMIEDNQTKNIIVNLSGYDINNLKYIIYVCQTRNKGKIITKNLALEEKYFLYHQTK